MWTGSWNNSFLTMNPNSKYFFFFSFLGGGGGGPGQGEAGMEVNGWTDKQAQTNLPLQLLRSWGHNNGLMYK